MKVFIPSQPKKPYGWALLVLCVFGAVLSAGVWTFLKASRPPQAASAEQRKAEEDYQRRMDRIQTEIDRNTDAMFQAEEFGDRAAYMGLVRKSAEKVLEGDREWERWRSTSGPESAPVLGVRHAITGEMPLRFTDTQKIEMLAAEHSLTVEQALMIKAELEVLFAEEWMQKFGAPHEHAPEEES